MVKGHAETGRRDVGCCGLGGGFGHGGRTWEEGVGFLRLHWRVLGPGEGGFVWLCIQLWRIERR